MTDRLNELARAITEAEDELNTTNHRDNCQQLAVIDTETRPHLVERIEAREKALDVARDALRTYAAEMASEGAVKVEIATNEMITEIIGDHQPDQSSGQSLRVNGWDVPSNDAWTGPLEPGAVYQTATITPPGYSNGLGGHKED